MLYLQLPFYGKRGSIAEIKETEKTYDVSTYNNDGKASITSKVKKKRNQCSWSYPGRFHIHERKKGRV